MQKSMTGFGRGTIEIGTKKFTVEIRSLNSKQLDLNIKFPSIYRSSEMEVRSRIASALQRGKIEVWLTIESSCEEVESPINEELFGSYLDKMIDILTKRGISPSFEELVPAVLRLPNVVSQKETIASEDETQAIVKATDDAIEMLLNFRIQEGETLTKDLLRRVDLIEQYMYEVEPFEKERTKSIHDKMKGDIERILREVDENRLEQEMIYYIEKLDITEEKVRLHNHCKYFREVAQMEEFAGRKLSFIAQEMGREINTTGSKANNTDIQILVVKMKDELEKIKEQVLNLL